METTSKGGAKRDRSQKKPQQAQGERQDTKTPNKKLKPSDHGGMIDIYARLDRVDDAHAHW